MGSSSTPETGADKCPVDHSSGAAWSNFTLPPDHPPVASSSSSPPLPTSSPLPNDRETSSIPRPDGSNWEYPSQSQFYSAMARKNHSPRATDMPVLVPIHNAVNERAWAQLMDWERALGDEGKKCGGVKLVSFKGRPQERSLKARLNILLGYQAPFDRHDWVIDRCGVKQRYIIDFYTGRNATPTSAPSPTSSSSPPNLAFYLDVRPAVDNWDGLRLRALKLWESLSGPSTAQSVGAKKE